MLMHPVLMLALANERRRDLIAEAGPVRVPAGERPERRSRWTRKKSAVRGQPAAVVIAR